jgi:hypothetical protein
MELLFSVISSRAMLYVPALFEAVDGQGCGDNDQDDHNQQYGNSGGSRCFVKMSKQMLESVSKKMDPAIRQSQKREFP